MKSIGIEITEQRKTLTALLLIPVMFLALGWSCNVQSVVSEVDSILAEVGPALQIITSLLPLLSGKNIPANVVSSINVWVPQVEKDVATLQGIIQQYQSDLSDATVQAQINAAIQTTENDVTSVLVIIHVLDPATQQKISELVTAVGAAIISVENIVNQVKGTKALKAAPGGFYANGSSFKNGYNTALHLPTGDAVVDAATAKLSLE